MNVRLLNIYSCRTMLLYVRSKRRFSYLFIRLLCFFFVLFLITFVSTTIRIGTIDSTDEDLLEYPSLIFCLVLSANSRHLTSSKTILYSWGKRCDRFYFLTRLQNTSYDLMMLEKFEKTSDVTPTTINRHTVEALDYILREKMFSSYRWFIRSGDDSFVIVPNLRKLVNELERRKDSRPFIYVGDVERLHDEFGYQTSGSVMLFNRPALEVLVNQIVSENQPPESSCFNEITYDHELIQCFKTSGIRINSLEENLILSQNLSTYRRDERLKNSCCDPKTVAFRVINETDMHKFEFFYHRLDAKPFIIN